MAELINPIRVLNVGQVSREDQAVLDEGLELLAKSFRATRAEEEDVGRSARRLADLGCLSGFASVFVFDVWRVEDGTNRCEVAIVQTATQYEYGWATQYLGYVPSRIVLELSMVGSVELGRERGHVLVRPETLQDKVVELFRPREVDFDSHPRFSQRYYVLASDEALLRSTVDGGFLEAIHRQPDMVLEIHGTAAAARPLERYTPRAAAELARFLLELAAHDPMP